ncbi:putative ATP-grasp superfamily ATP-dependent carboligase [Methanomicrobium sp. W14]|uniref:ATP-grasp domain-containing protein n=1 Tax=Methanomicrobium sp. W14 TaxID=2817839 RepID=UPI001AEA20AE|nr:ATP-grasp domain-containing protein [Methanomicrobium sp. W14]MBP2132583.1 putative ATP-grasp superfamily ATP-dependent carboligase [Methanomicrobium sp. W14]
MSGVLVAGFATRHVVCSAYNAGYRVYAIDSFCDQDLRRATEYCRTFEELAEIPGIVEELDKKEDFDFIVTTSGAENLEFTKKVCGTDPKTASCFLNKKSIQDFFESNSIPAPVIAENGQYPAILKPCTGAGGWRNQKVSNLQEEEEWVSLWPDEPYIRQEIAEGIPCSVSCISDGKKAVAVSFNEQFIRGGSGEKHYGFAGAVTPFTHPFEDEIINTAEKAVSLSGCKGSVGVDFIASENGFCAVEINPRFQATMDIVEKSYGINLFSMHINACRGVLPKSCVKSPLQYTARKVIFADCDIVVKDDLSGLCPRIADVPCKGTLIDEGSAVLSVYGEGPSRSDALGSLDKTIKDIGRYISRW